MAFAWCGNKAAAFWALLLRDSIHSPEQHNTRRHSARGTGEPGARRSSRVHRRGQCSLSLPWTQKRQRERFDCGRLAGVPRRRPLYPSLGRRLPIHLLLVPALEFRDAVRYFTRTVLLLITSWHLLLVLRLSCPFFFFHLDIPLFFSSHAWLLWPAPPTSFVQHCCQLKKKETVGEGEEL